MKKIILYFLLLASFTANSQGFSKAVEKDSKKVGKRFLDSSEAIAILSRSVTPEEFGAKGDSVTDDTQSLLLAAATGRPLNLNEPKKYLISAGIQLLPGQVIYGNHATIKFRNQISTTTVTPANNSTTVYTFANASSFRVGMTVAFADAGVAQGSLVAFTTLSTNNPKITAINGNSVTVSPAPNCTITGSSNVYLNFVAFVLADDSKVYDVTINGNKSNWTWGRWECTGAFGTVSGSSRSIVRGNYVYNMPGEGMVVNGNYHVVANNTFQNINGNGVHLSGATGAVIDGNHIVNANLDQNVGHVMGCIGWSNVITDATIVNNYLYGGVAGIGKIDSNDNSDNTISNNTIRSATTYGIDLSGAAGNTVVSGNRIYDCGSGGGGGISIATGTSKGIQIIGNLLSNNSISVASNNDILIINNQFVSGSNITLLSLTAGKISGNSFSAGTIVFSNCVALTINDNLFDYTGNQAATVISTNGAGNTDCTISRNTIYGGLKGIDIVNGTTFNIVENSCIGQAGNGIIIEASGSLPYLNIRNNYLSTTANTLSSWVGIRSVAATVTIKGNQVNNTRGSGGANYGILIGDKCLIDGNTVRGVYNVAAISIAGTSTNSTVCNNVTDGIISDGGVTTQKVNNTTTL